jgi:hypothetical protein
MDGRNILRVIFDLKEIGYEDIRWVHRTHVGIQ